MKFIDASDNTFLTIASDAVTVDTDLILYGSAIQKTSRQAFSGTGITFPTGDYRLSASTLISATTVTISSADIAITDKNFEIKDEAGAAATNNITITCEGIQTIDGQSSVTITANYGRVRLYSNGTNLFTAG